MGLVKAHQVLKATWAWSGAGEVGGGRAFLVPFTGLGGRAVQVPRARRKYELYGGNKVQRKHFGGTALSHFIPEQVANHSTSRCEEAHCSSWSSM